MKIIYSYFKQIFIALICLLNIIPSNAQVLNTETFDNATFLPAGWSSVGTTNLWSRRTTGTFPTCTPQNGAGMVRFSSRAQTAGTNQTIATPVIDLSSRGSSVASISFWIYRDNGSANADSISLYINTSASLSGAVLFGQVARYSKLYIPDSVFANGWYKYSFNIPAPYTGGSNYILIKGISQNGFNTYLDEIQWTSYPNLCTGKPSPGTAVPVVSTLCNGGGNTTINLNGQSSGVTGLSYQWKTSTTSSGPWSNTGSNSTSLPTGNLTSNHYYKCIITCSNSGLSDSTSVVLVTVKSSAYPNITVTPGNANFCTGSSGAKLVANGGNTYLWSPTLGLSSTTSDTVYASPTGNATYTVKGTDTAGCTSQASTNVSIRQSPVVQINTPDSMMCLGDSVQLQAQTGGGGNTYLWTPGGKTTALIFASPATNTQYHVTATNGFGCKGNAVKNVLVLQKPIAFFEVNVFGRTYYFFDSSQNASSILWDFGDGNTSSSRNPVYTYSFDGTKTITMIANNPPCGSDTFSRTFNVSSLEQRVGINGFALFPNPAKDVLTIHFNPISDDQSISISELSGQLIWQGSTENKETIRIDISHVKPGIYFFRMGVEVQKLIIE